MAIRQSGLRDALMLSWFRPKRSPEAIASELMPRICERWIQSFNPASLMLPPTPSLQFKARREWVLLQFCAFTAGGLVALEKVPGQYKFMAAVREKAAELLMPEGLFSEAGEVTFLLVERLQGYGAKSPKEVGKQLESYLGVEPNAFRWVSIASSYFQSIESSKTLFEELKTSLRW